MIELLHKNIPVFGTLVNVFTIVMGSSIGLIIHSRLPEKYISIAFQGIGIITLFLGFQMAQEGEKLILIIFSILLGGILGEWMQVEERVNQFINRFQKDTTNKNSFAEGLVSAFLLFCMGSMTFLGALEEGMGKFPNLLIAKSILDGFSSIALASTLGIGVMFSIFPLFIYQGGLTLFSSYLTNFLDQSVIHDLTATGGLLLIGLGIHLLKLREIRVLNFIPALLLIVLFRTLFSM
jgi:hypothetical protein